MAFSAHKTEEEIKERFDSEQEFERKMDELATLVANSKHFVIFTGAGISTSVGIPDFRGPQGVWTLKAKGETRTTRTTDSLRAIPSKTHMAIQELQRRGICKYLISQNCDGLHRRSGIKPECISELHGNGNIEYCATCGFEYLRDFHCYRLKKGSRDHYTGRHCVQPLNDEGEICNGRLMNSTIDFGQSLPVKPLELAHQHSLQADLHLVLGSSLTVQPACNMPKTTAKYKDETSKPKKGVLVICNLQTTPLDSLSTLRIFEKTDKTMEALMQRLNIPIPPFQLHRFFRVDVELNSEMWTFRIRGIEKGTVKGFEIPASIFRAVQITFPSYSKHFDLSDEPFTLQFPRGKSVELLKQKVIITLHFMGNYNEPPLTLPFEFPASLYPNEASPPSSFTLENKYEIIFTPTTGKWEMGEAKTSLTSPSSTIVSSSLNINLKDEMISNYVFKLQRKVITPPSKPLHSKWLSSSLITNAQNELMMIVFGGIGSYNYGHSNDGDDDSDGDEEKYFGYRCFNLNSLKWNDEEDGKHHSLIVRGDDQLTFVRKPRWGHSATEVQNRIYMFGGFDHQNQYNDLFEFDPLQNILECKKTTGNHPCYRALHTATYIPHLHSILIFGGANCEEGKYRMFNDVYLLDVKSLNWTEIKENDKNNNGGATPCARSQHSSVLIGDNEVAVMGGITENGRVLNDIWVLNLIDYTWRMVNCSLPISTPVLAFRDFRLHAIRAACTLVSIALPNSPSRDMILFSCKNGLFLIDTQPNISDNNNNNEEEWKITTLDDSYTLSCHAVCSNKSTTIFTGGIDNSSTPSLETMAFKVTFDISNNNNEK